MFIEDNHRISSGNVADLRSSPGGRPGGQRRNGDYLKVEFVEIADQAALEKRSSLEAVALSACP